MQGESLYPLKLQPALHVKVWGGRKLSEQLHKPLPTPRALRRVMGVARYGARTQRQA